MEGLSEQEFRAQESAKRAVSKIAKLKVNVTEFLEESQVLQQHNYVYKTWARCEESVFAT